MTDSKQLIVVLGAHRSGTSLCTAAIEALGADACLGEHYANEENRKGFFEHPELVAFNERLLQHLGGSWDNPLFDGVAALAPGLADSWYVEGSALLTGIYGSVPVAVLKDPRLCQLLTFWRRAFELAGYRDDQVHYVHVIRDPAEVAVSQKNRALENPVFYEYGLSIAEGAALWVALTGQALTASEGLPVAYLNYADLLGASDATLARLAAYLGLNAGTPKAREFSEKFVDRGLYRSAANEAVRQELAVALPWANSLYAALQALLQSEDHGAYVKAVDLFTNPGCQQALVHIAAPAFSRLSSRARNDSLALQRSEEACDDLGNQLEELRQDSVRVRQEHEAVLSPLRDQLSSLEEGNAGLKEQLAEQAAELVRVTDESHRTINDLLERKGHLEEDIRYQSEVIAQMEQSLSWRVTRPLRGLNARLGAFKLWRIRQWSAFRLRSIRLYHRMSLTHPALAYGLRRLVRPFFRASHALLGGSSSHAVVTEAVGVLSPMRYQQTEAAPGYSPLVSVIVPNYNHAKYLRLRLDSIYSQSYRNFEVILLDDASTDKSSEILREYAQRYPENTTLVENEVNSGGVFHQWDRGLELAKGGIVWIAESDDWCTENFLQALVPFFENEAVQIAYTRTVFMDGAGEEQVWSIQDYLHDIDPHRWNGEILATGPQIVRDAFALKNIIPNVSSALMRSPRRLEVLADPAWRSMRTCGDWVLYLHLLRGGMLAYSPAACNYYRIHGQNTSVSSYGEDAFYREHETVAKTLRTLYATPVELLRRLRDNLEIHWRETRGDYTDEALASCFSVDRIVRESAGRCPNLLIASYAFCAGGGETFPVSLANIMKGHGYNVTYLDCAREPRMEGVRSRLRADIPVVSDFTQLERIIADFEIDIVHSHHAWVDSTILELLPASAGVRVVVTSHGMYETINEYDLRHIIPRLVERTAAIIYVAEKNLEAVSGQGLLDAARVERIDNALEPVEFPALSRAQLGVAENAFLLSLVSRGMVEKGWQEAVEAVALAREASGRDIQLLLVGDGPEYERMAAGGVPEFVHLEGFQENVRGYFAVADMGLLPSKFRGESFPLVIIESLQTGTPFLASDLGEIGRMLSGPKGVAGAVIPLLAEEIDIPALADAIALYATDAQRMTQAVAAVAPAAEKFDPAVLACRHDEVYRSVLALESSRERSGMLQSA